MARLTSAIMLAISYRYHTFACMLQHFHSVCHESALYSHFALAAALAALVRSNQVIENSPAAVEVRPNWRLCLKMKGRRRLSGFCATCDSATELGMT